MALNTATSSYGANALGSQQVGSIGAIPNPKLPTIASAVGRIESLNTRLSAITSQLSAISDAIGGPRPTNGMSEAAPAEVGVVYRLNGGADQAHRQAAEIEDILNSISRALG